MLCFSSMALKPSIIGWIRTGSQSYWKIIYSIVLQNNISFNLIIYILISAESCLKYDTINNYFKDYEWLQITKLILFLWFLFQYSWEIVMIRCYTWFLSMVEYPVVIIRFRSHTGNSIADLSERNTGSWSSPCAEPTGGWASTPARPGGPRCYKYKSFIEYRKMTSYNTNDHW